MEEEVKIVGGLMELTFLISESGRAHLRLKDRDGDIVFSMWTWTSQSEQENISEFLKTSREIKR